jgi:hypothetical protein
MADNSVFITGAAKGAFEEALATMPGWATEKTLLKIQGLLQRNLGQQTKLLTQIAKGAGSGGAGGLDPATVANLGSEFDKWVKTLAANNKEEEKKKKRDKERAEADKKSLLGIKSFDNGWQKAAFVLGGVVKIGNALLKVDQQYMKTSDELYKSGVNLMSGNNTAENSIMSLNQAVTLTGLRLETLQEVALKYANTINAVGFSKFAKATGLATQGLKELGFSGPQTAELIGTYAESLQGFTDIRQRSEKDMAEDVVRLGGAMGKLSLQVGISQKQLESNLQASSKSTNALLIFSAKGEAATKNLELFSASFKDRSVGNFFEAMSAASDPQYTAGFKALQHAGLGDVANQLARVGKSAELLGPEEARKQLDALVKSINPARFKGLQDQLAAGGEGAQEAADMLAAVRRETVNTTTATGKQTEQAVKSESVITNFNTELERSKAILQAAFPPLESQIVTLTHTMEKLNDAAYAIIDHTNVEARSWLSAGTVVAGFVAGTLLPMVGKIGTVMNLFGGTGAASTAAGGTAAAGGAGLLASTAAVAGAGAAGYLVGDQIINPLIDGILSFATNKKTSLGEWIYDSTHDAYDPNKTHAAPQTKKPKPVEISVPKAPAASTINSPSAVPSAPSNEADTSGTKATAPSTPVGPGIEKPPANTDINSMMAYQNNVLEQILLGTTKVASINADILRYTRNQT